MTASQFPQAINGYLNQYIQLMDAKAAAVAAAALVLIGLGLSDQAKGAEPILRVMAISFAGVASIFALMVVLPRTPHSGNGHIFWADIRSFQSADEYWKSLKQLSEEDVGREYARQNYFVGEILKKKGAMVRRSILWFAASCIYFSVAVGVS